MLLRFLQWLGDHSDLDFSVVLIRGGPLTDDFATVAPVTVLHDSGKTTAARRVLERAAWDDRLQRWSLGSNDPGSYVRRLVAEAVYRGVRSQLYRSGAPDLVYLNTAASGSVLAVVPEHIPVLTHVHELDFQLRLQRIYEPNAVAGMIARSRAYLAPSSEVAEALARVYGVGRDQIGVCPEFTTTDGSRVDPARSQEIRNMIGAGSDTVVIGSVGTIEWRKGADLFIQLAKRVIEKAPTHDVKFLWLGDPAEVFWREAVRHDLSRLGLIERVHFHPAVPDPRPFFAALDIFALTSRSDSFPIACLEAAAYGKPVICFDGAGGMTEFLGPNQRLVLPYLDVAVMAARVAELIESEDERRSLGQRLAARVDAKHRLEISAPLVLSHIERALGRSEP